MVLNKLMPLKNAYNARQIKSLNKVREAFSHKPVCAKERNDPVCVN